MIAIVLATGQNRDFHGLDEHLPIPLIPLVDRPFLQHVVESLAHQGIRQFEFILSHLPEKIEEALGDGARWGCSFRYHFLPPNGDPLRTARTIAEGIDQSVLLASGVTLPDFEISAIAPDTLICRHGVWTGWGVFEPGARLLDLPVGQCAQYPVSRCLSAESGREFLRSQSEALSGAFPGLIIGGRESDPGVWISRNVQMHPSVMVNAPVYIGENCRIGRGARIGPSAVIGANCIIDALSMVVNATVSTGTYIGEALELDSVVVDRNRLVNVRLGTSFLASETFLLGSLTDRASNRIFERLRDRVAALLLLFFLWPVLLLTWLYFLITKRGYLARREVIEIPAVNNPAAWRTRVVHHFEVAPGVESQLSPFLRDFLPGLISILQGSLFFTGARPRSRSEIEALPSDWRHLYLRTKAGLITEANVMFGSGASEDELYTSEVFYSATESFPNDLKLLTMWLWKTLFGHGPRRPELS